MHEHKRLRTKYSQTAHNCSINVQNVRFDSLAPGYAKKRDRYK